MDEISKDKLSQLLSNPDSLKALSSIAKGLMTDEKKMPNENTEQITEQPVQKVLEQTQVPNTHYDERLNLLRSIISEYSFSFNHLYYGLIVSTFFIL
jgi:hypothetical protein